MRRFSLVVPHARRLEGLFSGKLYKKIIEIAVFINKEVLWYNKLYAISFIADGARGSRCKDADCIIG